MGFLDALPDTAKAVGSVFDGIKGIVRNFVKDPNEADERAAQITMAVRGTIQAEAQNQFWLVACWRPVTMLMLGGYLMVQGIRGLAFVDVFNGVLFSVWVAGLMGYKFDGKVLEFLKQAFTFARGIASIKKEGKND